MSGIPDCALVRGYVLNKLQHGPVSVADLIRFGEAEFGFSRAEIQAAGEHFAVVGADRDGELYWMRPANLFAIWWGLHRDNFNSGGALSDQSRQNKQPSSTALPSPFSTRKN